MKASRFHYVLGVIATFVIFANGWLLLDGCNGKKTDPAAQTAGADKPATKPPADPTDTLANEKASKEELQKAIAASKEETRQLKQKYDELIQAGIVAKLWWAFGICCLAIVACGAAAWFLPLFRKQALQGVVFSILGAGLCLVLMKLVPHMWQIAWGIAILAVAGIVFYFLRHAKGVSTAFAWTSEFAEKVGENASVAAEKEKFFINKLASSKAFSREELKALRDKALGKIKVLIQKA